ncbi:MAG: imidazole glycerol phosphate synthase subunit HisH [Candidatus Woesearchaeota archaeon]|nr:imidazole glycerol phosphate synthase subunit HisH [Candidatus Woesearchaeota archaeon]
MRSHYAVKEEKNNLDPGKKTISVIDYGLGNLKSVISGFQRIGHKVAVASTPEEILNAESIVLPGVGAFEDGMKGLRERNLIDALHKYVNSGKPLLGICLGTQLLMSESEEFGLNKGLDIIKGRVVQFKDPSQVNEKNYRVPHIGWNSLILPKKKKWSSTILSKTQENSEVYFVHSFIVVPNDKEHVLATTEYGGQEFCSLLKKGNIYGCQFHPEKSGEIGSKMLEVFGSLGGA